MEEEGERANQLVGRESEREEDEMVGRVDAERVGQRERHVTRAHGALPWKLRLVPPPRRIVGGNERVGERVRAVEREEEEDWERERASEKEATTEIEGVKGRSRER